MKIIINRCFGGYGVSTAAVVACRLLGASWAQHPNTHLKGERYSDGGVASATYENGDDSRKCPHMIALVESDPVAASGPYARLCVVEIPDDEEYEISEYDGQERIGPPSSYWG